MNAAVEPCQQCRLVFTFAVIVQEGGQHRLVGINAPSLGKKDGQSFNPEHVREAGGQQAMGEASAQFGGEFEGRETDDWMPTG